MKKITSQVAIAEFKDSLAGADLSDEVITDLLFVADLRSSIEANQQLTGIEWVLGEDGPEIRSESIPRNHWLGRKGNRAEAARADNFSKYIFDAVNILIGAGSAFELHRLVLGTRPVRTARLGDKLDLLGSEEAESDAETLAAYA